MNRQAWIEINLNNLKYNYQEIKKLVTKGSKENKYNSNKLYNIPKIASIIKANAYGCGAIKCAKTLEKLGCEMFAVATVKEAIELRQGGIKGDIILLGIIPENTLEDILEYNLCPIISSKKEALALNFVAEKKGKIIKCVIAIDTGMGRIGWRAFDGSDFKRADRLKAINEIKEIDDLKSIEITGFLSHFSSVDGASMEYTNWQLENFLKICEEIEEVGVKNKWKSIANSGAILEYPESFLDVVRPGIIMYGCYPSSEVDREKLNLKPVMSVKAEIVHIKTIEIGDFVGYGRLFKAKRNTKIATIPIGYADGYSRLLTGKAEVLIKGKRAKVVGAICMDQCMIDVTDIDGVEIGDEVIIMGEDVSGNRITSCEIANLEGTINYEVLCSFGIRLPHKYIGE